MLYFEYALEAALVTLLFFALVIVAARLFVPSRFKRRPARRVANALVVGLSVGFLVAFAVVAVNAGWPDVQNPLLDLAGQAVPGAVGAGLALAMLGRVTS